MIAVPPHYATDTFSDLPGNEKGTLGAPGDYEGGFNITASVESTYSQ